PMPVAIAPFSMDECDCSEVYSVRLGVLPLTRASGATISRAHTIACMLLTDAVSYTIPNQPCCNPIHCLSQSSVTCSSSAMAGDVFQCSPFVLSAAASISPRTAGVDPVQAK